jgi:S1-C subfamily serine protease
LTAPDARLSNLDNSVAALIAIPILAYALAWIARHLIELPGIEIGRRIAGKYRNPIPTIIASESGVGDFLLHRTISVETKSGVSVSDVADVGPADKAGGESEDIIVELNSKKIEDVLTGLMSAVARLSPKMEIPIGIVRAAAQPSLSIKPRLARA